MAAYSFIGTWEITGCVLQSGPTEATGIEGTQFHLDESGDVTWTVSEGAEALPLFNCETYEIYSTSLTGVVIRFGAFAGHVLEFRVDHPAPNSSMLLTCDNWCLLQCRRVTGVEPESPLDFPFSLLPALEEGFFSDVTIRAANNKKFAVHSCVLRLGAPELDWDSWLAQREEIGKDPSLELPPPPLSGLPEDVLATLLHYVYSQSLPPNLSEETATNCIASVAALPGFSPLAQACQLYLNNMALKHQIIGLVTGMHACALNIINYFNSKASPGESGGGSIGENLGNNPAKLCFVVKQAIRESAVAAAKLVLLCELFSKRKAELSREERHEVIRYAKSRLPVFLNQLCRLLHGVKATFSTMSSAQRHELATYLVPEIETVLDAVSSLAAGVKVAIEQIMSVQSPVDSSSSQRSNKSSVTEILGRSLWNVLHIREVTKLRNFHQRITCSLVHLIQKKESFSDMTTANKVRSVSRNLEQLIEELPVFLLRLEEVMAALDEKLEWREFKFCFKVGTSKVSGALQKLLHHRPVLQDTLTQLCEMVQRDAFTQSLVSLALLDPPAPSQETAGAATNSRDSSSSEKHDTAGFGTPKQHGYKLNLVESFCVPPVARHSRLSSSALQLLRLGDGADMLFEIISVPAKDEPLGGESASVGEAAAMLSEPEICTLKAHRVIVAARCDWFRRALLSGMRESIDRKIVIHDTSPGLFRIFLDYLYCGRLEPSSMSADLLTDLMLLADRYELDCLKQSCEHALKAHIDDESALYLLSMADQFNARLLRSACLNFISMNPDSMESEQFEELPQNLQAEVYDQVIWLKPKHSHTTERLLLGSCHSPDTSPTSVSSSLADVEEMTAHLNLRTAREESRGSVEELLPDPARLEACLAQLQDIVGVGAPHERLVQVVLAADYDVNRALNFFFSASPSFS